MANNLTGAYEAVLQVAVHEVNALLAAMHQARMDPLASPSFPHGGSIAITDRSLGIEVELSRFRKWTESAVQGLRANTGSAENARAVLSKKSPPGVAALYAEAWHRLDQSVLAPAAAGTVSGIAEFQLSAPRISVVPGSASEVTVHVWVRARFRPDPGAAALPAPIHGEVRAVYAAQPRVLPDGRTVLRVQVSSDDQRIQFLAEAGTGLGASEAEAIAKRVRAALRKQFAALDVPLPPDFSFSEFGALGAGGGQAMVLPLQLSGGGLPPGQLSTVTNHFLGSSDFAIAVSRDYVQGFLDTLVSAIKAQVAAVRVSTTVADYTPQVTIHPLQWTAGAIHLSGRVDLIASNWAPDQWVTFKLPLEVALDVASQTVSVRAAGEPDVDESTWVPHDTAVGQVKSARDGALPGASASLNASFQAARGRLDAGLKTFDKSASARYTAVEVTPDGILARGAIALGHRLAPVVHSAETDGGSAFTAFHTWIPGGRVQRYDWTWVERTHLVPWFNKTKHVTLDHEYVCPRPADVLDASGICLRVEGERLTRDGVLEPVTAGTTCTNSSREPMLVHPSWWMKMNVPIWVPDPPDLLLPEIMAGHVNMAGDSRAPGSVTTNVLVHFTGRELDAPLFRLAEALGRARREGMSLLVILVLPQRGLSVRRSELEDRLGRPDERFGAALEITEDYAGGWTRTFAAPDGPGSFLVNARGEFVWGGEGRLEPATIARALDEHALEAPRPRLVPLGLNVAAGAPALDAIFMDDQGMPVTLRRLRGRRVALVFWQSWSEPCLRELRRLQDGSGPDAPLVLAVNGGEGREALAEVRHAHGLRFALIHDPEQTIATLYGVRCWPTTVVINEEGIVERIQFGLTHEHRGEPAGTRA